MIKIALDTSCLNANKRHFVLNQLEALHASGKIQLITSTVNEKEQDATNLREDWRKKYLKEINSKVKILETGKLGISSFGECVFASEEINTKLRKILPQRNLDGKVWYDFWLLETAVTVKCDFFLTMDTNHFIENGIGKKLEIELGIRTREPNQEFLNELNEKILNS
ncbi:hypothetical protein ES702_03191 [subsurface metagenome]